MIIPKYIDRLPFLAESLKRDLLKEYDLSWTEFLTLSSINQFEQKDIYPSPQKIITTLGMNRGWVYRAIKKLHKEAFIFFQEGKPFEPGKTFIAPLGTYTLRRINRNLARMVWEMRKNKNSLTSVEDCV